MITMELLQLQYSAAVILTAESLKVKPSSIVIIGHMNRFKCGARAVNRPIYRKEKGSAIAQPAE
jgi:hypothetical protein